MENKEPTYEELVENNIQLMKEIWQLRSHIAQRELVLLELNQYIREIQKSAPPKEEDV